MFKRHRRSEPVLSVERTAARLAAVLATPGPHDDKMGHHRTYEGNTDPTKRGLAVGAAPRVAADSLVSLLRWRACGH